MARNRANDFKFGILRECTMPILNSIGPNAHAGKRLTFSKIQARSVSVLRFIMHDWCLAHNRRFYVLSKSVSRIDSHGPSFRPFSCYILCHTASWGIPFSQMPKWCRNSKLYKATLKMNGNLDSSWPKIWRYSLRWQEYDSFIVFECCHRAFYFPSLSEVRLYTVRCDSIFISCSLSCFDVTIANLVTII